MHGAKMPMAAIYQKIIVLCWVLLIIGNIFQFEPSSYLILLVSVFMTFLSKRLVDKHYYKQYLFIIAFFVYGIAVAFFTRGGVGAPLTIIAGLIVVYASQELKLDRLDLTILTLAMLISMGYWLYRSPTYYAESFFNHWKGNGSYTNSNSVGHYLAYECAFVYMIISTNPKKHIQIFKWILTALCIWGCINVKARMALMTLILFLFINFIIKCFYKYRSKLIKLFLVGSILLEIIFPFIYLGLYKIGFGKDIKMFGLSEKGLYSGREGIWQSAFDAMNSLKAIAFGIGSKHDFWTGKSLNMHNNAMNLLVITGIIGMIVYFSYLIFYICKNFSFSNASKIQWQCLIFFICIIVEGTTDITLFYNNFLAYYFIPLGIALNKNLVSKNRDL